MSQAFASADDVAARWRPLSDNEVGMVTTLLEDASDIIRIRWPDVDARIASGALAEFSVMRVAATMVKRALDRPTATEGFDTFNQTVGPFAAGGKLTNPNANLFLNAEDVRLLDGPGVRKAYVGWSL